MQSIDKIGGPCKDEKGVVKGGKEAVGIAKRVVRCADGKVGDEWVADRRGGVRMTCSKLEAGVGKMKRLWDAQGRSHRDKDDNGYKLVARCKEKGVLEEGAAWTEVRTWAKVSAKGVSLVSDEEGGDSPPPVWNDTTLNAESSGRQSDDDEGGVESQRTERGMGSGQKRGTPRGGGRGEEGRGESGKGAGGGEGGERGTGSAGDAMVGQGGEGDDLEEVVVEGGRRPTSKRGTGCVGEKRGRRDGGKEGGPGKRIWGKGDEEEVSAVYSVQEVYGDLYGDAELDVVRRRKCAGDEPIGDVLETGSGFVVSEMRGGEGRHARIWAINNVLLGVGRAAIWSVLFSRTVVEKGDGGIVRGTSDRVFASVNVCSMERRSRTQIVLSKRGTEGLFLENVSQGLYVLSAPVWKLMETGEWQAAFHAAEADQYGVKEVQGVSVLARELAEEDTVCKLDTEGEV